MATEYMLINPISTANVAADSISGLSYQRIKLIQGNSGVNDGDVSASNPLNTQLSDDNLQVLLQIRDYVAALQQALGTTNEIRISLSPSSVLHNITLLGNQTQIGGYNASYYIANQMNMDYQSSNSINLVG